MSDFYHEVIVNSHVMRFRNHYKDFFVLAETRNLSNYFFERIYNLEGKAERDAMAVKTYNRFKAILSERARERIEKLLILNEITDDLDVQMAQVLSKRAQVITTEDEMQFVPENYFMEIYREANTLKDRVEQLRMVIVNLESFFELSKHPLAEMVMKPAAVAAMMVGAKRLFHIFEEGYSATKPVQRDIFFNFTASVRERETAFLEKIYNEKVNLS